MVIDSHIHAHIELFTGSPQENRKKLLADMHAAGVDGGAIFSLNPTEYTHMTYRQRLEQVLELCGDEKWLFPFFYVNPLDEDAVEQLEDAAAQGVRGFKIICKSFFPHDERCLAVCRKAAELHKPVTFHSGILWDDGDSARYNRPLEFEGLLRVPQLRFTLAHISWPWCEENVAVYGKLANAKRVKPETSCEMFVDTVPGTPRNRRRYALELMLGGDYEYRYNLMFGTDCHSDRYNIEHTKEWLERDRRILGELGFGDPDFQEHYFCRNFLRYIGEE